jgi:diaminohydroxyphosphoribosylaminopyrimidine deaminase / 5-amino-6-(5-phosphoribosylamino)uracil reductase
MKQPRVTVKLASSLDGKTALENGQSQWITGPDARCDVQYFRALHCAVLTGSGTVIVDNPSLNVRYESLKNHPDFDLSLSASQIRQPLRIILDSHNKLTLKEKLFSLAGKVLLVSLIPREDLAANKNQQGADIEQLIGGDDGYGRIDLKALLTQLNAYEINDLWVESGATLAGEFFKHQLVDQFILYQAPKLMGNQARDLVNLPDYSKMDDVVQLTLQNVALIGDDIRIISNRG